MNPLPIRILGYLTLILVLIIVSFSAGWKIKGWKYDSQYKQSYIQAMAEVKTQDLVNQKMAQEYKRTRNTYQKQMDSINAQVKTEVVSQSVYDICIIPASGLQLINAAINTTNQVISS